MNHAAVVIPGLDRIGGAENQAVLLAAGLRRRGWRVSVVALTGSGGAAAEELAGAGVGFISLHMRKGLADPRGWLQFHRWLCRERPDVVHAHLAHAAWLARWSRLAARAPVVLDTLHSSATGGRWRRFGYAISRWLPDQVTAVSQAVAASHCAAGMVEPERLRVVGNGVAMEQWLPSAQIRVEARKELGAGDAFLWLAAGRLESVKDYPTLLRAFARVNARARLLILGTGPLEAELRAMTTQLGLSPRVHFAGFCRDVRRWMQAADGVALASRYEGLPMVLLEAGACALPVVATDVAGTREAVADGETGWLVPAGDGERMAAAMDGLMQMPAERRQAMGKRAREHVAEHFSLETALDRWEELYAELRARRDPARSGGREPQQRLRHHGAGAARSR